MRNIKPIHIAVGILGLIAFVLTGQYMAIFLKGLDGMADGPRLLYRSSHLYLMWSALANLLVGAYFKLAAGNGARIAQVIASVMILIGPILFVVGFFVESPADDLSRVYCDWANYLALAGIVLHVGIQAGADRHVASPPAK